MHSIYLWVESQCVTDTIRFVVQKKKRINKSHRCNNGCYAFLRAKTCYFEIRSSAHIWTDGLHNFPSVTSTVSLQQHRTLDSPKTAQLPSIQNSVEPLEWVGKRVRGKKNFKTPIEKKEWKRAIEHEHISDTYQLKLKLNSYFEKISCQMDPCY